MVLPPNLPQLPGWPLVQALEPPLRLPDGFFSVQSYLCRSQNGFAAESQHQQPQPRVVRGQKSRLLLLPWPSIICKLAWGAISQTNPPPHPSPNDGKKKYCYLGILLSSAKTCTCEDQEPADGWLLFKGRLLIYSRWVPVKTVWTNERHLYECIVCSAISEYNPNFNT